MGNSPCDSEIIVTIGVCAMERKVASKPMKEILRRMDKFQHIRVIVFDENVILSEPVESWPVCDALISFYSDGFPLKKAIEYSELRHPYLVNDLESQYILMDRKRVYECLQREGVPVPRCAYVIRDGITPTAKVVEADDSIEIDGKVFQKPFVEKPINAEDHNVYMYFPSSAGGGSQRLFRKVGNLSSRYYSDSNIRTEGSYMYEEFLPTDGTDVKVYTVADDYAHAEARKSPALDGVVERDHEGKEVRYPVILTPREKNIAKKVANAVKQQICGFDLLRANGMSYVCDVNGFSFVKSSRKYYDDCSHILGVMITRKIAPRLCLPAYLPPGTDVDTPLVPTTCGTIMELRCVIAVIRHGDRTPKQKMKMEVRHEKFFALFTKYASGGWIHELKLKRPTQLQEVLEIVRCILHEIEMGECTDAQLLENKSKFEQLRYVLEMYGSFSGINRKIQLKYHPHGVPRSAKANQADNPSSSAPGNSANGVQPSLLLVVKWGGELTPAGRQQAENLGRAFRCIYPGGDGHYGKDPGLGLLRLHSTYRHDLKIYASDEGRVQMTAAAFAKGFLALEGELPPILVQMVKSANTNGLLDNDHDCRHYQNTVKRKIREVMSKTGDFTLDDIATLVPTGSLSMVEAMRYVGNPRESCDHLFQFVRSLHSNLYLLASSLQQRQAIQLYQGENWDLLLRRWGKLLKDFKTTDGDYDLSKISDIYDNIKYDLQHNPGILVASEQHDFFMCAKSLADIVVPQEYGITREEKLVIGQRICTPLMRKVLSDARYTGVDECTRLHAGSHPNNGPPCADCYSKGVASPERFVRTRLYFTSESHLHSLLTCLRYGGLADVASDEQWRRAMEYVSSVSEINYLAQIVIMIYEDPSVEPKLEERYHVELHFSPGAYVLCHDVPERNGLRSGKLERLNSQASMLSSGTSLGKCSTESLTQHSTRVGTHGSVTPNTYAPPRQKGISDLQKVASELSTYHDKQKTTVPDDQLLDKSPEPFCANSLLADLRAASVSNSSLTNLGLSNPAAVIPDCLTVADRLHNLNVWRDAVVSASNEVLGSIPDDNCQLTTAHLVDCSADDEVINKTESEAMLSINFGTNWEGKKVTLLEKEVLQQQPSIVEDPVPYSASGVGDPTSHKAHSISFDPIHIASNTSISSLPLPATLPIAQETSTARSLPPSSNLSSSSVALIDKKINIGRFLITRSGTDQQDSLRQQHSTFSHKGTETAAVGTSINSDAPPVSYSSTTSLDSNSQTYASAKVMLSHATRHNTRQAISCPPDGRHTTDSGNMHSQAEKNQSPSLLDTVAITAPTVLSKLPNDTHRKSLTKYRFTAPKGSYPTRHQKDDSNHHEHPSTMPREYHSLDTTEKQALSKHQQQPDMEELGVQATSAAAKLQNQLAAAESQLMPAYSKEERLQLAFHRAHHQQLVRRHSTGSLMLPHHQIIDSTTATLHSAGVSGTALSAYNQYALNPFLGFFVDPSLSYAMTTATTALLTSQHRLSSMASPQPPDDDTIGTTGNRSTHRKPRKRVGRVTLEGVLAFGSPPSSTTEKRESGERAAPQADQLAEDEEYDEKVAASTNQALNALTFPSSYSPYLIDFNRLARSIALGIPFPRSFCRSLISTAVIRGSRHDTQASSSVPDIKRLMEDSDQPPRTLTPGTSSDFPVPSAPSVPEVYPLETLHNSLTLNQLETFFARITTHKFETPFTSPQNPSTPISFYQPVGYGQSQHASVHHYGSATSLPTTMNDACQTLSDELMFFSTPPNQYDLPFSLELTGQEEQPQQYAGSLLRIYSADNMVTTTTTTPSFQTSTQPSSSTTDGFGEVTSDTMTDYYRLSAKTYTE